METRRVSEGIYPTHKRGAFSRRGREGRVPGPKEKRSQAFTRETIGPGSDPMASKTGQQNTDWCHYSETCHEGQGQRSPVVPRSETRRTGSRQGRERLYPTTRPCLGSIRWAATAASPARSLPSAPLTGSWTWARVACCLEWSLDRQAIRSGPLLLFAQSPSCLLDSLRWLCVIGDQTRRLASKLVG